MTDIHSGIHPEEARYLVENLRETSAEELRWLGVTGEKAQSFLLTAQKVWVVYSRGVPAATFGAHMAREGVWTAFGFGTDAWQDVWRKVTMSAKRELIGGVKSSGAHRIQCMSPASHHETHKWLRFLGLTHEVDCPAYGTGGEDFKMFAWIGR